jgi:lysophospholipase L1-like esterase
MDRLFGDGLLRDEPVDGDTGANSKVEHKQPTSLWFSAFWGTNCPADGATSSSSFPKTLTTIWGSILDRFRNSPRSTQTIVWAVIVVGSTVVLSAIIAVRLRPPYGYIHARTMRVAFLGNSITFVNDLPRFMQALSQQTISQDSCLHGSLNFASILTKGNGMYNKWQTVNSKITNVAATSISMDGSTESNSAPLYDFGACTFTQLLLGYDESLTEYNANGYYTNDGMNPCFQDVNYLNYLNQKQLSDVAWDYVIFNDQTVQPAVPRRRRRSLRALKRVYAALLKQTSAVPVFLSTYGYDKSLYDDEDEEEDAAEDGVDDDDDNAQNGNAANKNADIYDSLGDIAEFTSRVWYGYQQYAAALGAVLPPDQQPILVPSALAFLAVWEENYNAWLQLFYEDGFHPSPHGTYLLGCCLYASLYQRMPPRRKRRGTRHHNSTAALFGRARRMHMESMGDDRPFPTDAEADYLTSVAERVVLGGHIPTSLLSSETIMQMEANEAARR